MITYKSPEEIEIMKLGGNISKNALNLALGMSKEGVSLLDINNEVDKFIVKNGAFPSFKRVPGYHFATCININEGLVHGIPTKYVLKKGDLVKIDLGVYFEGFNTDTSATKEIGTDKEEKFIKAGIDCIDAAISQCIVGNRLGDISNSMQKVIESRGYTVSRSLVGHGIGRDLHEEPLIPPYGKKGTGLLLREGLVFAIEIIYQKGSPQIRSLDDGWTLVTKDGSLAGLHEHTVAITKDGPLVLTK
jgi:methionyl aminopeptidase